MKFKSAMVSEASGSIGGITFAHNAGGLYMRARRTPTDPGTIYQTAVRQIVASLVNLWVNVLTQVQRDSWDVYAENVPLDDVFGDPRYRSGINHYVRSNVPRMQFAQSRIDTAPTIFDLGEYTLPVYTGTESDQKISTAFNVNDDWVGEDDAFMFSWGSRPQNASIQFFKGPYRSYQLIAGDSAAPPTSPVANDGPFAFSEGNKLFLKSNVSRADGRLSTVARTFCVALA